MLRKWTLGVLIVCAAVMSSGPRVEAADTAQLLCQWVHRQGEVPVPYKEINRRVELAHGVVYALEGRVRAIRGLSYFEVDARAQPWLGVSASHKNPLYPMVTSIVDWTAMEGKSVRMVAKAIGMVGENSRTGEMSYQVWLEPIMY